MYNTSRAGISEVRKVTKSRSFVTLRNFYTLLPLFSFASATFFKSRQYTLGI